MLGTSSTSRVHKMYLRYTNTVEIPHPTSMSKSYIFAILYKCGPWNVETDGECHGKFTYFISNMAYFRNILSFVIVSTHINIGLDTLPRSREYALRLLHRVRWRVTISYLLLPAILVEAIVVMFYLLQSVSWIRPVLKPVTKFKAKEWTSVVHIKFICNGCWIRRTNFV